MSAELKRLTAPVTLAVGLALALPAFAQLVTSEKLEPSRRLGGYHVVLLTADNAAGPAVEGVTPAVTKALNDVQQFLPFKSYRLVDSMLLLGTQGGTTRIVGPEKQMYVANVTGGCDTKGECHVLFILTSAYVRRLASGEAAAEPTLSNRLTMKIGETAVVGISRVSAESGLIAVLTAVPESAVRK